MAGVAAVKPTNGSGSVFAGAGADAKSSGSEEVTFPLFAGHSASILWYTALSSEVATKLQALVSTNTWKTALVNPIFVMSPFQVLCACAPALIDSNRNQMHTRSLSEEIVWNLSATTHVPSGLKKFGFHPSDKSSVLIVFIDATAQQLSEVQAFFAADKTAVRRALSELPAFANQTAIKKEYGLAEPELTLLGTNRTEAVTNAIVCRMAQKHTKSGGGSDSGAGGGGGGGGGGGDKKSKKK